MIRLLLTLVLVAGGFGAGFYLGIQYRNDQIVENPEQFFREYGKSMQEKAGKKYEAVKKALLED